MTDLDTVRASLAAGAVAPPAATLPPRVTRALALARDLGAPALPALDAATSAVDDQARRVRAIEVATAQARLVAGALVALPVVAVPGLGLLVGSEVPAFYATPAGRAVAVVAGGLIAVGALAAHVLVRRAARPPTGLAADLDEIADLLATALTSGIAPGAAARAVATRLPDHRATLQRLGLALERGAAEPIAGVERVAAIVRVSVRYGAPAAPALRRLARELRADRHAAALARTERLPVQLTFPTALCLLPATVLLVGAPLLAAGLAAAGT